MRIFLPVLAMVGWLCLLCPTASGEDYGIFEMDRIAVDALYLRAVDSGLSRGISLEPSSTPNADEAPRPRLVGGYNALAVPEGSGPASFSLRFSPPERVRYGDELLIAIHYFEGKEGESAVLTGLTEKVSERFPRVAATVRNAGWNGLGKKGWRWLILKGYPATRHDPNAETPYRGVTLRARAWDWAFALPLNDAHATNVALARDFLMTLYSDYNALLLAENAFREASEQADRLRAYYIYRGATVPSPLEKRRRDCIARIGRVGLEIHSLAQRVPTVSEQLYLGFFFGGLRERREEVDNIRSRTLALTRDYSWRAEALSDAVYAGAGAQRETRFSGAPYGEPITPREIENGYFFGVSRWHGVFALPRYLIDFYRENMGTDFIYDPSFTDIVRYGADGRPDFSPLYELLPKNGGMRYALGARNIPLDATTRAEIYDATSASTRDGVTLIKTRERLGKPWGVAPMSAGPYWAPSSTGAVWSDRLLTYIVDFNADAASRFRRDPSVFCYVVNGDGAVWDLIEWGYAFNGAGRLFSAWLNKRFGGVEAYNRLFGGTKRSLFDVPIPRYGGPGAPSSADFYEYAQMTFEQLRTARSLVTAAVIRNAPESLVCEYGDGDDAFGDYEMFARSAAGAMTVSRGDDLRSLYGYCLDRYRPRPLFFPRLTLPDNRQPATTFGYENEALTRNAWNAALASLFARNGQIFCFDNEKNAARDSSAVDYRVTDIQLVADCRPDGVFQVNPVARLYLGALPGAKRLFGRLSPTLKAAPILSPPIALLDPLASRMDPEYYRRTAVDFQRLAEWLIGGADAFFFVPEQAVADGTETLAGFKLIIVPYAPKLLAATQSRLLENVRNGAVLFCSGLREVRDEYGRTTGAMSAVAAAAIENSGDIPVEKGRVVMTATPAGENPARTLLPIVKSLFPSPEAWAEDPAVKLVFRENPKTRERTLIAINMDPLRRAEKYVFARGEYAKAVDFALPGGFAIPFETKDGLTRFRLALAPGAMAAIDLGAVTYRDGAVPKPDWIKNARISR